MLQQPTNRKLGYVEGGKMWHHPSKVAVLAGIDVIDHPFSLDEDRPMFVAGLVPACSRHREPL